MANYDVARIDFNMCNGDAARNKAAFDLLFGHKDEIEQSLGVELSWHRADEYKASWVRYHLRGVSIANEADWPRMAKFHAQWSDRICGAMLNYLMDSQSMRLSDILWRKGLFRKLCVSGTAGEVLSGIVDELKNHQKESLYLQMSNELDNTTKAQELITYVDMACGNITVFEARKFLLSCLRKSFEQVNNSECSISIIGRIKQYESYFKSLKEDTATILREGFATTSSEALKDCILAAVSGLKIKPQFKKGLGEEDLNYYKKWM